MKLLITVCLAAAAVFGQIGGVEVGGATSTRAILRYTAPSAAACAVEVSESSTYAPLVNDVNPALFAGANSDARFAALARGNKRTFVVGKRSSDTAADGKLYSRALQQGTTHYFRITCGTYTATGTFAAAIIPWGALNPDNPPFNPDGFGNYGWPTIDWSDKMKWYVDPMTGLAYKPINYPGEYANRYPQSGSFQFGSDFIVDSGAAWSNAANIRSGSAATVATTSSTSPIFLGIDPAATTPYLQQMVGIDNKAVSIDDIGVNVFGSGTDASAANRQIGMCWSLDWQTCYTSSVMVALPTGADAGVGEFPASFPQAFFGGWGKPITRLQLGRSGTVNVAGNSVSIPGWVYTDNAFYQWAPGTKIWIAGSAPTCASNLCTVASVIGPGALTIQESLTLTGAAYKYGPALRIVKTTATGAINLSVSHDVAVSNNGGVPPGGNIEICSQVKVTASVDRDGNPSASKQGTLCALDAAAAGHIYWIADDGETRLLSVFVPPTTAANSSDPADAPEPFAVYPFMVGFDPAIGTRWYTQMKCRGVNDARARCIFQLDYAGDFREWKTNPRYPLGNATQPSTPSDHVTWSNLTKPSAGKDVQAQIDASFPAYDKSKWGDLKNSLGGAGIAGNYIMLSIGGYGVGETPVCYAFLFDLRNGDFVRGWDNYSGTFSPYMRWTACHANLALGGPNAGYFFQSFNMDLLSHGAYTTAVTQVMRSGAWSTNTALPASYDGSYDGACPVNPYGATGNACVQIKVAGEPCRAAKLTNEAAWFPCPWDAAQTSLSNIAIGDMIYDHPNWDLTERLRVLAKNVISPTEIDLTLQRDAIPPSRDPACHNPRTHANGWTAGMGVGGDRLCNGSGVVIDAATGAVYAAPMLDHFDFGVGPTRDYRWVTAEKAFSDGGVIRLGTELPDVVMNSSPPFAGGTYALPTVQAYPSGRQWTAPVSERSWTLNQRHFTQWNFPALTQISGNLYLLPTLGTPDIKRMPYTVTAGPNLLTDMSGPTLGDAITPADTWKFCFAYRAGECRSGSSAGAMYVVTPTPQQVNPLCDEGVYGINTPCAYSGHSVGAWAYQQITTRNDPDGRWLRRLSMQPGPQRQPPYENWRSMPDGKMAVWRSAWTDGLFTALMLAKLPPAVSDSLNRTTFLPVQVTVGAGVIANHALVRFWYDEHGGYCSSRREACYAATGTIDVSNPFLYAHEVSGASGVACASGCVVTIPAISGRALYYEVVENQGGALRALDGTATVQAIK
jgi:hypothetical protein